MIGENNTGKSTILDALKICLTHSLTRKGSDFQEYDYHLANISSVPTNAEPIEITLRFAEQKEDEWPEEIEQILSSAIQVNDDGTRSIILRVKSSFDSTINDYTTTWNFLNPKGEPVPKQPSLIELQRLVPTFYLPSLRDAAKEFQARSRFWGPFVRSLDLDDKTREEFEKELLELNNKVLEQHTAFHTVKNRLAKATSLLPLGTTNPVSIEAIPSKVFDILSRTQVKLASKTGAHIPIRHHGSGTQSLAVICLFDAFLRSNLKENYGDYVEPLLTLEEPEAHLHPSAIKAVGDMLQSISGQKIVSTHSGDLLASIPLDKIRRLRRKGDKIEIRNIEANLLTEAERNKLDYCIRANRGSLLFSRCWLLVEGEIDALLLSECGRAMDSDLYANSISCIEFAQVGVEKLIKVADQLGIEWFVLADKDTQGEAYKHTAQRQLGEREIENHIRMLDHGSLEMFLCMEGFGDVYEKSISVQRRTSITANKGTLEYWKQVADAQTSETKRKNILNVVEKIATTGKTVVPALLQEVIGQVKKLAESAG